MLRRQKVTHAYVLPYFDDMEKGPSILVCRKKIFHSEGLEKLAQAASDHNSRKNIVSLLQKNIDELIQSKFKVPRLGNNLGGAINNRAGRLSVIGGSVKDPENKRVMRDSKVAAQDEFEEEASYTAYPSQLHSLGSKFSADGRWGGEFFFVYLRPETAKQLIADSHTNKNVEVDYLEAISLNQLAQVHRSGIYSDSSSEISLEDVRRCLGSTFSGEDEVTFRNLLVNKVHAYVSPVRQDYTEDFSEIFNNISEFANDPNKIDAQIIRAPIAPKKSNSQSDVPAANPQERKVSSSLSFKNILENTNPEAEAKHVPRSTLESKAATCDVKKDSKGVDSTVDDGWQMVERKKKQSTPKSTSKSKLGNNAASAFSNNARRHDPKGFKHTSYAKRK